MARPCAREWLFIQELCIWLCLATHACWMNPPTLQEDHLADIEAELGIELPKVCWTASSPHLAASSKLRWSSCTIGSSDLLGPGLSRLPSLVAPLASSG